MQFLNSNFKVSAWACWNESKKGLVRNSGNPESDNGSELAVIFTKELEVSYKRKVQTGGQLWKPDRHARGLAWSTNLSFALLFSSFHLYPTEIRWKRWKNLRSYITEIIFSILKKEISWKIFCCCFWAFFFFFLNHIPKTENLGKKKKKEGSGDLVDHF